MSAEPLRVIQVGAGSMGRAWLGALADSADVTLAGLVDLDVDAARLAAAECGHPDVPVAATLDGLADVVADAVLNVTVPAAHRAVSTEALLAGRPVLCEKPLAETVADGLAMVAAARVGKQLLMVSQSRRYWANLTAFRRLLAQIGPVGILDCQLFRGPRFGGFRDEMDDPLLVDMAIHQFDLARDLLGGDPTAVYCESYNPAWSWYRGDAAAEATFEFGGGKRFHFSGSWCSPGLETSWNGTWRASGAGGTALWNGDDAPVGQDVDGRAIEVDVVPEPEGIAGSLAEFVAAVRAGASPATEAGGNVLSLSMVEAAVQSAREHCRIDIAQVLADAHAAALAADHPPEVAAELRSWSAVPPSETTAA
ncbi:Gfo/Idh/MocA family oxidoreductase [Mycobacterium hodleri]|uniref:Gfo/Idh/MocA family oxidoreductase n=1 Tax=Mycolicibacterium hodleri TaxID=49897 RepID=A0A544VRK2_9MYCO|nr:Gfo/Idh/MocA family oxidoreductase [Mycolicibacterium hodleri]TQR82610.1 Gfo/Idh/MocA family oxidoreductase [Mycolicibacterium hodleri]